MISNGYEGSGVLTYPAGDARRMYFGPFKDGQPNGYGELDLADGRVFFGEFAAGSPGGLGRLIKAGGDVRSGSLQGLLLQAKGIEISGPNKGRFGLWASGVLIAEEH
jgi:hypothetical protein